MAEQVPFSLFVDCVPPKSTHQASVRIMKRKDGSQFVGKAQNSKGAQTQRDLLVLLSLDRPEQTFTGPVKLQVLWVYPWRKSEPKKHRQYGYRLCDKRPDCDNLAKILVDCITKLHWWEDDSQVAHLQFTKAWGDCPGIGVRVCALHSGYLPEYCNQFTKSNLRDDG